MHQMNNLPPPEMQSLASRFYAQQILARLTGEHVVFKIDVDRGDFIVEAGATGVVQKPFLLEGKLVAAVVLDDPPTGSLPYDGEVHWLENVNLFDFEDEVELV